MKRIQQIPADIQAQIDLINSQKLILAEVLLDEISEMPNYNQYLRVQDNNAALSQEYLKVIPKRILVHKQSGQELDLNLPVPNWERFGHDMAALVDATGQRVLVQTDYYQEGEIDENGVQGEDVFVERKEEPVQVPVLKYLMLIISMKKYKEAFEMFTKQYIQDTVLIDPSYFTRLK